MTTWRKTLAYLAAGLLAAGIGCAGSSYPSAGPKAPAAAISDRGTWRAHGDVRDPQKTIDGDPSSAAVTAGSYNGAVITIDLGKPCLFNMVVIDHGPHQDGFCRRVVLLTSLDDRQYVFQYSGPGTRRVTNLCVVSPILARYIRLRALIAGDRPWSIGELYVQ